MEATSDLSRTTTILVNNIHCASCVSHIEDVFASFDPAVRRVEVNILSHEVRILHDNLVSASQICRALLGAAFEVCSATTVDANGAKIQELSFAKEHNGWLERAMNRWTTDSEAYSLSHFNCLQFSDRTLQRSHLANCASCREEESSGKSLSPNSVKSAIGSPEKLYVHDSQVKGYNQHRIDGGHHKSICSESDLSDTYDGSHMSRNSHICEHRQSYQHDLVLDIDGMTSESDARLGTHALENQPTVQKVNTDLKAGQATLSDTGNEAFQDQVEDGVSKIGCEGSITRDSQRANGTQEHLTQGSQPATSRFEAVLLIGGMTCASCTDAINSGLSGLSFVENINVTLLTNSAVVKFIDEKNLPSIVQAVEDLGYECSVERCSIETIPAEEAAEITGPRERRITLAIDGMFCKHYPTRIAETIKSRYPDLVEIEKSPSLSDPTMTITYTPSPPDFTIRHIVSLIDPLNSLFHTTVHHPVPTEQRAQEMKIREQRRLLKRLLLCFLTAIPTFLIGVLWMSLVSSSDKVRMFMEQPIGSGKVSRSEWALFILATPVMFFAADVFHIRALKEIRALWRRSSTVPILRRFYRFGSMNLLMSAGTSVAYFSSVALLIMGATAKHGSTSRSETYFDTVVFLTLFILAGRYLEAYSKSKTGNAVAMLGKLRPEKAILAVTTTKATAPRVIDEKEEQLDLQGGEISTKVETDFLEIGDIVIVPQGSSPPADGEVATGRTKFDESSLTGESRPVAKAPGDRVYSGTVNVGEPIEMRITDLGGTSMLDQIISVVREGQTKRAPVERVVDRVTGYFVPIITALAILTFLIWFALGQSGTLSRKYLGSQEGGWAFWSLEFAIAVFVVACPCGIGLAAPTALFVGIGLAAKHGILVRGGGEAFQEASNVDIVVFDKTGTLTEGGDLKVTDHEMLGKGDEAEVAWTVTRHLEENSSHPIARALLQFSSTHPSRQVQSSSITEEAGLGIRGTFELSTPSSGETETYEAALGSESMISSLDQPPSDFPNYFTTNLLSLWKSQSKSVALLATRRLSSSTESTPGPWKLTTLFAIADSIRPSAQPTITALQSRGIAVYMLTGDNPTTAAAVATSLSIPLSNVFAGVLPTEKASKIQQLRSHGPHRQLSRSSKFISSLLARWRFPTLHHLPPNPNTTPQQQTTSTTTKPAVVAFIGDGINDAPALTAASVSISVSSASDIALSSSHFILLSSSLESVLVLLKLSSRVFRRVKMNFAWAVAYNALLVPVAAGVLFRVKEDGWRLGPVWGSAAMALSSLSVVGSSLALRWGA